MAVVKNKNNSARCPLRSYRLHQALVLAAAGLVSLPASGADNRPGAFKLRYALDGFRDTAAADVAWHVAAPDSGLLKRAQRFELDVGLIHAPDDIGIVISVGPVWRYDFQKSKYFVEFGLAPTLISLRRFGDADIGGHFHVTSSLSIGTIVGRDRHWSLALQLTHTSNGGLDKPNPGLDMFGISISTPAHR